MNERATVSVDERTVTVHVPMTFRKRGGRKMVVTPDGAPWAPRPRVDNAMVKALARAFRWQRLLDESVCGTIEELAKREKVKTRRSTAPYRPVTKSLSPTRLWSGGASR